jgi:ABC-type sugar transport system substrate-binding protein
MNGTSQKMTGVALIAFALAATTALPASAVDQGAIDFARKVVDQATNTVMSRDPLGAGSSRWTGAETSPKPVKDATIAVVPCPLALSVCQTALADATAAAEAIGWKVIPIDSKGDPAVAQKAVEAAINRDVSCVLTIGSPSRDIRAQIQRGKEKGIAFVTGFADDPREFGGDIGFGIDQTAAGKLLAAYVVANGGGNVVMFTATGAAAPGVQGLSRRTWRRRRQGRGRSGVQCRRGRFRPDHQDTGAADQASKG